MPGFGLFWEIRDHLHLSLTVCWKASPWFPALVAYGFVTCMILIVGYVVSHPRTLPKLFFGAFDLVPTWYLRLLMRFLRSSWRVFGK